MATTLSSPFSFLFFTFFLILISDTLILFVQSRTSCGPTHPIGAIPIHPGDIDNLQFVENLEHLEADYFLYGALGYGLDKVAPELVMGGPPPKGAKKANLDNLTRDIVTEFAYEEVGHLRAIKSTVGGFARPLMDFSVENFAKIINDAFGYKLEPPFNPYANSINYMISAYTVPYVGLTGYVGMNPFLNGYKSRRLVGGLLGVESGQDAVIRMYLFERAGEQVHPYNHTVAEFTSRISSLRDQLGRCGLKDEGVIVPLKYGAENKTTSNALSADYNSLSYGRTAGEILRIVYGSGSEHIPGGFFPHGGNGKIARQYLKP